MYAVKTLYNTDENNLPVPDDTHEKDLPTVYHGPFETLEQAVDWMHDVYPDNDTDVHDQFADDYDIPSEWLNDPKTIFTNIS